MKKIKLSQNKFTLVDDKWFDELSKFKWSAHKDRSKYYAKTHIYKKNGKRTTLAMHRLILELAGFDIKNKLTDHKNGDGLDNRLKNLRVATRSQNRVNSNKNKNNSSGYKGVFWHKSENKWISNIRIKGKTIHIGYFNSKEEAARAFDKESIKYHGEFAKTNF